MKGWSLTFLHDFLPIYCFLKREVTYIAISYVSFMFYYKEKVMLQKDKTKSQKFQSVYINV